MSLRTAMQGLTASLPLAAGSRAALRTSTSRATLHRPSTSAFRTTARQFTTETPNTVRRGTSKDSFRMTPTTAVLICVPLLTGALGIWQIQRLQWKLNLIDEVDRNVARDPMILPDDIRVDALGDFAFRRVLAKGRFEEPVLLLGPRVYEGAPGFNVVQPFVRSPSNPGGQPSTILVNRGFVTTTRANAYREGRDAPPPGTTMGSRFDQGEVVIEALVRKDEGRRSFQPDNDPAGNTWYWSDVAAMAKAAGGEEKGVQPVLIDQIFDGKEPYGLLLQNGVPIGRPPVVELRNQHATYAATCAVTTVMLVRLITKGRVGPAPKTNPRLRQ